VREASHSASAPKQASSVPPSDSPRVSAWDTERDCGDNPHPERPRNWTKCSDDGRTKRASVPPDTRQPLFRGTPTNRSVADVYAPVHDSRSPGVSSDENSKIRPRRTSHALRSVQVPLPSLYPKLSVRAAPYEDPSSIYDTLHPMVCTRPLFASALASLVRQHEQPMKMCLGTMERYP